MQIEQANSRGAEALKRWREKRALSQAAAAEQLGVTQATWSDWEAGKKTPDTTNAVRLQKELGIKVELWMPAG